MWTGWPATVLLVILTSQQGTAEPCVCNCTCTYTTGGLNVDCSYRNMTRVPRFPNATTSLNLTGNNLHELHTGKFSNLQHLVALDLSNAALLRVHNRAFQGLKRLEFLNISQNENLPITDRTMNASVFKDLEALTELRMYGTTTANLKPDTYPDQALGYLGNLQTLWMDGMTNKTFGSDLTKLKSLHTLRFPGDLVGFGFCNILTMNGTFDNVASLTHLYVLKCGLHCIDKDAFRMLRKLQYLDLSSNRLLTLTGASEGFSSLQYTNISVLILNDIRETFLQDCGMIIRARDLAGLQNTSLVKLYLEHNGIAKIKDEKTIFPNLPNTLKVVSLRDNTLEFDVYLFYVYQMKNLTYLDISFQFFQELWNSKNTDNTNRSIRTEISSKTKTVIPKPSTSMVKQIESGQDLAADNDLTPCRKVCIQLSSPLPYVIPFLPEKMEYLDASHSKMNHPLYNVSVQDNYSLKRINASYSMLYCWQGPIYGLHALQYFDLSNNLCDRVSTCFFDEFRNLTELTIANNLLNEDIKRDTNGYIMKNLKRLQKLDMSHNSLQYIPPRFLWTQMNLQVLNLSSNLLTSFDIEIEHMENLRSVDLSENHITTLAQHERTNFENVAEKTRLTLDLTGNSIHCYCKNIDTLKWVRNTESTWLKVILERCYDDKETLIPIRDYHDLDQIISRLERRCVRNLVVIITATVGTVIFTDIIVGILVYRYRWKLRYWYYISRHYYRRRRRKYQRLNKPAEDSEGFMKYDVYVICSEEGARGQFVNDMFAYLQNENGLNLIEQERNFLGNGILAQMICSAIHQSHVSIFVMTKEWIQEGTWEFPMQICRAESLSRGKRMYFSVFPEGLSDDIHGNKKWRELCDIEHSTENLEYPGGEMAPNNMDEIQTFWKECLGKISRMMRKD